MAFMRLGDDNEATKAAEFIGRDHRFVLTQLTNDLSRSEWVSGSSALKSHWSNRLSQSYQRVYEYTVEPTTLQRIPEYATLLVIHEQPKPVVQAVECRPDIVLLEKFLPRTQQILTAVPTHVDHPAFAHDLPSHTNTTPPLKIPSDAIPSDIPSDAPETEAPTQAEPTDLSGPG